MTAQSIPAKETRFDGIKYRSRLEARYAVMFRILGLSPQYEPEKYDTPAGAYIPDFWIPEIGDESLDRSGAFVEVKGVEPDSTAIAKADSISDPYRILVFLGPDLGESWEIGECKYCLQQCPLCGRVGFRGRYRSDEPVCHFIVFDHFCVKSLELAKRWDTQDHFNDDCVPGDSPIMSLAKETAKSARFEDPEWHTRDFGLAMRIADMMRDQQVYATGPVMHWIYDNLREWTVGAPGFHMPYWASKTGAAEVIA